MPQVAPRAATCLLRMWLQLLMWFSTRARSEKRITSGPRRNGQWPRLLPTSPVTLDYQSRRLLMSVTAPSTTEGDCALNDLAASSLRCAIN